ncbi:MAG: response regulator [Acidobacteriia bacterium]|nr:response regulator [Terriglobia bacterium]
MATILIVDDDPDVVEACRLFLERDHHKVVCAYSRAEGMKAVARDKPDLLILDVIMEQPDDGIAMAQELRRTGFSAPILLLTSLGTATGFSYGKDQEVVPVDEFHEKPIEAATLVRKVNELLAKRVR